jgi:exopolysaccharide biosynthesis polyprenyl glycosylphosphotransferase
MKLSRKERTELLNDLYEKYGKSKNIDQRLFYLRKKYFWVLFVQGSKFLKRALDIIVSLFFLILFLPIILCIMLAIKLQDGGPIFYVTDRVGKWGQEFRFPKFRSMTIDAAQIKNELIQYQDHPQDITFKMKKDPRITKLGKFLRKTSLDELPQLWTVFKGDMSLVGPRPPLPEEVAHYNLEQRRRLDIKPGITGIWQISGRSEIPFAKQVELDREYIESQSFWLDLKILLKTIPVVILGKGAY